jgi:hypothetical protein
MRPRLNEKVMKGLKAKMANPAFWAHPVTQVEGRFFLCGKRPCVHIVELETQVPNKEGLYAIKLMGMSAMGIYDEGGGWIGDWAEGSFSPPSQTPGVNQGTSAIYAVRTRAGATQFHTFYYNTAGGQTGSNEWFLKVPPQSKTF